MVDVTIRDESRVGRIMGGVHMQGLPVTLTVDELLEIRIRNEVGAYNEEPGLVFEGLVQPSDSLALSDGYKMVHPRRLDAERMLTAAREAVRSGLLRLRVGDVEVTDLDAPVELGQDTDVVFVKHKPIVARAASEA